jgi:hypothetical protein
MLVDGSLVVSGELKSLTQKWSFRLCAARIAILTQLGDESSSFS